MLILHSLLLTASYLFVSQGERKRLAACRAPRAHLLSGAWAGDSSRSAFESTALFLALKPTAATLICKPTATTLALKPFISPLTLTPRSNLTSTFSAFIPTARCVADGSGHHRGCRCLRCGVQGGDAVPAPAPLVLAEWRLPNQSSS